METSASGWVRFGYPLIHLAIGKGFPEAGGKNRSSIHVDMLCDVSDGEIRVDDVVVYRKGKFID